MSLTASEAFLYAGAYAFIVYGGRFVAFAAVAFLLADPARRTRVGRQLERPAAFRVGPQLRRELAHSLLALSIFSAINGLLYASGAYRASLLYLRVSEYPAWWFWTSIAAMIVLHDTLFYWLHRAMHSRALFANFHRLHHDSLYPTAFAAYSFSWREATAEALIVTAIIFIIPVHPLAFLIFQTISTAYNVYGHCGSELYPPRTGEHWLGKWLNTSSLHAHHHRHGRGNYSFYFTFWDRWMGTLEPPAAADSTLQR
jgi:lathosterol oxidase